MVDFNDDGPRQEIVGGPTGETNVNAESEVRKYQRWIRSAEGTEKEKYNKWAKKGAKLYSKCGEMSGKDEAMNRLDYGNEESIFHNTVNYIRQPIERQIAQTYARNPKFVAKPLQPIWVDAEPVPIIDPMTGQPVFDPMTGQPMMDYRINPETGMPFQEDISEEVAEIVEAVMEVEIEESDFKSEIKLCTREAHHSPASILQVGYEFNPDTGKDGIYFRRRKFTSFIIDPKAQVYDGIVRRCRYMGLKWKLTKEEAESLGLNWSAMSSEKNLQGISDNPDDKMAVVYNIWDRQSGVVVWVPEHGPDFAKEPAPWPWKINKFPFVILKFSEDVDKQFSKPPVLEVAGIQEELEIQREEIAINTVYSRPYNMYDSNVIDETKMVQISGRGKNANIPIDGLLGMPNSPIRRESTDGLTQEYYNHYERNRQELVENLGSSQNEALRTTKSTAAEAEIVNQNAGTSTSAKIDILTDFMDNAIEIAIDIMKDVYDTPRVSQVVGRDNVKRWVQWTGSQILKDVRVKIEAGSTEREDSAYNRQVSLNMLETMKSVPGIDILQLAVEVLQEHGKRNAEQYRLDTPMGTTTPQPQGGHPAGVGPTQGANVQDSLTNQMSPLV